MSHSQTFVKIIQFMIQAIKLLQYWDILIQIVKRMPNLYKYTLPIVQVKQQLNYLRLIEITKKIDQETNFNPIAIALIVSRVDQPPFYIDCLAQHLKAIRKRLNIPIIGFSHTHCTPESYYLLSICNRIFSDPAATFMLKYQNQKFSINPLLAKFNIQSIQYQSKQNLLTRYDDTFKYPAWMFATNYKRADLDQRLFNQALKNRQLYRQQPKEKTDLSFDTVKPVLMGSQMKKIGLVDSFGHYPYAFRGVFKDTNIEGLDPETEKIAISKLIIIASSPILLMLLMGKVIIKWTLIFYAYFKAMGKKSIKQLQQEYEATYNAPAPVQN